jgi:two-component system response regulator HydG
VLYRLTAVDVRVPPLRDRREDIPYLTAAFVRQAAVRLDKRLTGLTPTAERALMTARGDGNVRELRNVVEHACILARSRPRARAARTRRSRRSRKITSFA